MKFKCISYDVNLSRGEEGKWKKYNAIEGEADDVEGNVSPEAVVHGTTQRPQKYALARCITSP